MEYINESLLNAGTMNGIYGAVIHNDYGSMTPKQYVAWLKTRNLELGIAHYYGNRNQMARVIDTNKVAWHTASSEGNGHYIGYEVCESLSASDADFLANEEAVFKQVAEDFKFYGIAPNRNTVRLHKEFTSTSCPHRSWELHGRELNAVKDYFISRIKAHMTSVATAPVATAPTTPTPTGGLPVGSKVTVRASATHYQTGQPIASWVKGKTYTIQQVKAVNQSASKRAYLLSDIVSWVLEQDLIPVTAQTAKKPTRWINSGSTLRLPGTVSKWRVYRENGPYTVGNEVGYLNPAKFGGLTYEIKGDRMNDVVVIDTQDFGRVAIYAAPNTGATIKQNWIEVEV